MTTSETVARNPSKAVGFTLIEVLLAFAVLISALTLISAAFSRHLAALQLLQQSIVAHEWADRQLIEGMFRRQVQASLPARGEEGALQWELSVASVSLEPEPLKEIRMDEVKAEVNWPFRNQSRSLRISAGFSHQEK